MAAATFSSNISMLAQSDARFYDADNSNYIGLQAPSSVSATIVYNLPAADGSSGDVLQTDGAGTLSFTEVGAAIPAGSLMPYAGSTAPSGWLLSYGQAVSRTTYSALFTAIGTTYGTGDGSTTFNVPDLRGRLVAGQDDMGGVSANRLTGLSGGVDGDTLGASGGAETHTLTTAELAAHTHGDGSYAVAGGSGGGSTGFLKTGGVAGSTAVTGSSGSAGSGTAHNNVQPTFILNYIIRT
jgi:microcystin-dependent protein